MAAMTEPTRMERYMGFLVQEWARLAVHPLTAATEPPQSRTSVLDATIAQVGDAPGLRLEFGVWQGKSIQRCAAACPDRHWYGFDSFEGFPDDGRVDWQKPFKVIDLPDTPPNVTLVKGYFSDTLDAFLDATPGEVAFVNVDCDIYSSTVDIFAAMERHDLLKPGVVVYFDELINYNDYMWNESLALFEMCERTGLGIDWICYDHHLRQPERSAAHFHDRDHPTWMDDMRAGYWMQASCRLSNRGIDCGPMDDAAYRDKLAWMAEGFAIRERDRRTALNERNARIAAQDAERQERYDARKALEKQRQQDNMARRRKDGAARQA